MSISDENLSIYKEVLDLVFENGDFFTTFDIDKDDNNYYRAMDIKVIQMYNLCIETMKMIGINLQLH